MIYKIVFAAWVGASVASLAYAGADAMTYSFFFLTSWLAYRAGKK